MSDGPGRDPDGGWLTYRYRLGGPAMPERTGTMKAPTFLDAARAVVARRLTEPLSAEPVYLRLRAAGEAEVLVRVTGDRGGGQARPRFDVVPLDAYAFAEPDEGRGPG